MAEIALGSKLSHFEILEKLGEGGMGVVYKARDLRLDRIVAIKVLPEKAVADSDREARFVQEAKSASALNHPNIVTVYEIDTADGATFIAMEYIDGRTLDQVIPRKGLRFTEALKYAVQITDALSAAHGIRIIHRDLKPANIMVTGKTAVKVLDFGLAKLTQPISAEHSAPEATVTMAKPESEQGALMGTVAYMSPEQAEGKPIDARSDIFSFGIVLYEMLTGRRPFRGETKFSTLAAIIHKDPTPARQIVEGVPAELDRIVFRCLRKDAARRFQHMSDLHVALAELKEESDSGSLTLSPPAKQSNKFVWLWLSVAVLVVIAGVGVWLTKRPTAIAPPQQVVAVTSYSGSEQYPSFSPDGNQVAFSWDGEKGDNTDIYVKLLGESNALRLTHDPAEDVHPVWSPDGKRIAFQRVVSTTTFRFHTSAGSIFTISPLGGAEHKLSKLAVEGQMSWSPDGKWLAVAVTTAGGGSAVPGSGLFLVPTDGGEPRQMSKPKAPSFDSAPSISPSGRWLAYAGCTGGESCDLYVQDLNAAFAPQGSARRITHQGILINSLTWARDEASLIYEASVNLTSSYLWKASIHTQQPPQRLEIAGPSARSPSLAAAGNRLGFARTLENYDIWRYRVSGGMEPFIVSSMMDDSPAFSPKGDRIAFTSDRSGEASELWIARADGSDAVQMTNQFGRLAGMPRWSPDARWIALDSLGQNGEWHVYVLDANGGPPRRITVDTAEENLPSWSRDGKWIYFCSKRTGRSEIWRTPFAGGPSEQITADGAYESYLSADSRTVFYTKDRWSGPLFSKPVAGGPETQLLAYVHNFAFVPVEDGIYYIGQKGGDGLFPLQFFQFSSNTSRLLTRIDGEVELGLTVSPDRKTILFTKSVASGADLMMIENFQ